MVPVSVTVVSVLLAHHFRLMRALFIPHVGNARMNVHREDGGRGDRAL